MNKLLIIFVVFGSAATGISIFFYLNPPFSYYDLEIQGMKDIYHPGEEYFFYYTLNGYGNTCHTWKVSFPDEDGGIQHRAEAIDCFRPDNKQIDYDSRDDLREFSSKVPMVEGRYNVTVSLENLEPAVHEFLVLPKEEVTKSKSPERRYPLIENLLTQNNVTFSPSNLVVTSGPSFSGDPGCGAVIDDDSDIHWFEVDSRSDAQKITLYSENPNPCKINWGTCFCNAQTKLAVLTIDELSYLTAEEEEKVGKSVKRYFENIPHQIPVTKFVVGKYNLDLGEKYNEICGILLTRGNMKEKFNEEYSVYKYFSAAKEGIRLWDFSLSVGSENLCAVSEKPQIFEYEKPAYQNEN